MPQARFDDNRQVLERKLLHLMEVEISFAETRLIQIRFAIRLAFAATVHQRQENTFDGLVVDVLSSFFCAGQFYLEMLRVWGKHHGLLLHELQETPLENVLAIYHLSMAIAHLLLLETIEFYILTQRWSYLLRFSFIELNFALFFFWFCFVLFFLTAFFHLLIVARSAAHSRRPLCLLYVFRDYSRCESSFLHTPVGHSVLFWSWWKIFSC